MSDVAVYNPLDANSKPIRCVPHRWLGTLSPESLVDFRVAKGDLNMPNLVSDSNDPNVVTVTGNPWSPISPHREKLIQLQSQLEDLMHPATPQFVLDRLRALHADISRELRQ